MKIPAGLEIPIAIYFLVIGGFITIILAIFQKKEEKTNHDWDVFIEDMEKEKHLKK
jgi:hypothetical protein